MRLLVLLSAVFLTAGTIELASAQGAIAPRVAAPLDVVARMLLIARVSAQDTVFDLGCGDGRIVIEAARRYRARGVCVDIDPDQVRAAADNARNAGVADLVTFRAEDARLTDLTGATVVTLYLSSAGNAELRRKLMEELRPGTRIVSFSFSMRDWEADEEVRFRDRFNIPRRLFLWRIQPE